MAVTVRRHHSMAESVEDPEFAAFQQLFGALAANAGVSIIGVSPLSGDREVWVRLTSQDEELEYAVYDAVAAYHGTTGVATAIDLHVVLPDEPDSAYPTSVKVLYRRP